MVAPLDRKITILRATKGKNGLGEKVALEWVPYATVQAAYEPISDIERLNAGAVEEKADARFTLRYSQRLAAVDGKFRLSFGGDQWQITGARIIGRRQRIELAAWKIDKPGA